MENAETMETSTGLFDQAFSETIIDYCNFQATMAIRRNRGSGLKGGMSVITDTMAASVAGQGTPGIQGPGVNVSINTAVTAMSDDAEGKTITVTTMEL
jgi:hypothetical protein